MKKIIFILGLVLFTQSINAQDDCASAPTISPDIEYTVAVIDGTNAPNNCIGGSAATLAEWYKYSPNLSQ